MDCAYEILKERKRRTNYKAPVSLPASECRRDDCSYTCCMLRGSHQRRTHESAVPCIYHEPEFHHKLPVSHTGVGGSSVYVLLLLVTE